MTPGPAVAAQRYPVMRCWNPSHNGLGTLYYAPSTCEVSGNPAPFPLLAIARLSHMTWSHWGKPTATGTGRYTVYGQGPGATFAATVKVYRLLPRTNPKVCRLGGGAYSRLRVTFKADGRTYRPVFNVTPIDAGC
jgi:hypothetical protein